MKAFVSIIAEWSFPCAQGFDNLGDSQYRPLKRV